MEVSNEIKEDIRKTQSDLKNAIRVHQIWVSRLQEDQDNKLLKFKVREAEKDIIAIGQTQKLVVDRLRRELELYQQRLKARNKQVNIENDNRCVAQQLRDHQMQRSRNRSLSLLKPSVLSEILIKSENNHDGAKDISDPENENKFSNEKENSNHSEMDDKDKYHKNYSQLPNTMLDSRSNFANALNKVKESLISGSKVQQSEWHEVKSDSDSSVGVGEPHSPSPSPPPLPAPGEPLSQETFMRLIGLVTPAQKEVLDKKRKERRKRATTSTNRTDFLYGNFDMLPKRKKYNQFPYLQPPSDPPQTRSAKLRKQQITQINQNQNKSSREGSPSGSSTENKGNGWSVNKPAWAASLPAGLSVEPVYPPTKKLCHGCGRGDVLSLLVYCSNCSIYLHTGCGEDGRCPECRAQLPEPPHSRHRLHLYTDKLAERKLLQEKNIELCVELRKLETRAATLKENLDEHNAEKRQLLAEQIRTQRNLQKLLDFISQFKETSASVRSTSASASVSVSESCSEVSKSNEE